MGVGTFRRFMLTRQSGSSTPCAGAGPLLLPAGMRNLARIDGSPPRAPARWPRIRQPPYDGRSMSNTEPPTPHHETPALIAALSDGALRRASSAAIFQRGKTYATSGAVQVLSEEPGDTPA